MPLGFGSTITLGFQVQDSEHLTRQGTRASLGVQGHLQGKGRSGRDNLSAATSSTEMVDYVPSPPRRESAEGGEVVGSLFNVVTQPADVALFLGSPQGASLYNGPTELSRMPA